MKMHPVKPVVSVLLIALVGLTTVATSLAQQNILLIIADDLGADSIGLYSTASTAPTPVIDSLAADGVLFTNAWANPTCSPTRAGVLTGRASFRTGVGHPGDEIPLTEFTIPDALDTVGYATACIGKWHLGGAGNGGDDNPNLMGYDHYEGATGGGVSDYYNWTKVTNGTSSTVTNYATSETVDNALTWFAAQGSNPWFCQLAFNAPHTPFHKPPNALHSYDSLSGTNADINNNPLPYYQAAIEAMDTEIGRLMSSMNATTLANTNIIFVGDNGTPVQVSPGIVNAWKGFLYEGGVHVPFIASGPAVATPLGRTNDATIHTVDLFETVLELAGVDIPNTLPAGTTFDSVSIADYLTNPAQANYHAYSFTERFRTPTNVRDGKTIRNSTYKLIQFDSTGGEEFYNLVTDPTESNDLLPGGLNATELANYNTLVAELDTILNGGGGGTGGTVTISDEDFEGGWGIWNDGGADARRSANDSNWANSGTFCIRLRDNTNTSVMTTDSLDLSVYTSITVDFSYVAVNFNNSNEDFWLQISLDGGSSYTTVEEWNLNDEFSNTVRENDSVTIAGGFTANTLLRFRCDASANNDRLYIDDVVITGEQP
ncbi:MAG: sulfatase-like hydrolase/transferase [Verrucomicrobiota bacterium]